MKICSTASCSVAALALAGCATAIMELAEPSQIPSLHTYAVPSQSRTLAIPVRLEISDPDFTATMVRKNIVGTTVPSASFNCGEIIEREFRKVVRVNFREPVGDEQPDATLAIRILGVCASQDYDVVNVDASVSLQARFVDRQGNVLYKKDLSGAHSDAWVDKSCIPGAMYSAIDAAVKAFLSDGDEWTRALSAAPHGRSPSGKTINPPSLESLEWDGETANGIKSGRCVVKCNDYEGFKAKEWADAQIFSLCRRQLGNIEAERVRVTYDDTTSFDPDRKTWSISFKTFSRTTYIFDFNPVTLHGFIIGDLELMGLGKDFQGAAEKLKGIVFDEMGAYGGPVSVEVREGKALIRFGKFSTDGTYNLITIKFKLVD